MLQSTSDYYILFVPLLLLGLSLGLGMLWWNFRQFISIFWLAVSACFHGTALFIQSLIPIQAQSYHYFYLLILYLITYITFTQSVLVQFKQHISIKLCLLVICLAEIGVLYFSFIHDQHFVRMLIFALGTVIILWHKSLNLFFAPAHQSIEKILKFLFFITGTIFIFRCVSLSAFIYRADYSPIDFGSISHWFLNQLTILIITILFAALLFAANFRNFFALQKSKIKTQEQLQFSHDLHDIVGSTLVRSISRLNNNKQNMDNQQFLLLFEQLKSDLSQVTTNERSDQTHDLPLTPAQWALPIRQRFDAIFIELGITLIWQLSENWHIQPSKQEMLTLQRVTEELFTNIIKHSQAQKVCVHLYHSSVYQFILEIEDDGIGFDSASAFNNNHGVGLRSIRQRLQSIQTEVNVYSNAGKTSFQILKLKSC